jgi:hypothetical protein
MFLTPRKLYNVKPISSKFKVFLLFEVNIQEKPNYYRTQIFSDTLMAVYPNPQKANPFYHK